MSVGKFFRENAASVALFFMGMGTAVGGIVADSKQAVQAGVAIGVLGPVAVEAEKKLKKKYPKGNLMADLDSIGGAVEKAMRLGPVEGVIQEKAQILQVQNKSNRLKMENGNDAAVVFKNMSMPGGTSLN